MNSGIYGRPNIDCAATDAHRYLITQCCDCAEIALIVWKEVLVSILYSWRGLTRSFVVSGSNPFCANIGTREHFLRCHSLGHTSVNYWAESSVTFREIFTPRVAILSFKQDWVLAEFQMMTSGASQGPRNRLLDCKTCSLSLESSIAGQSGRKSCAERRRSYSTASETIRRSVTSGPFRLRREADDDLAVWNDTLRRARDT
jgi:hypothetical protein